MQAEDHVQDCAGFGGLRERALEQGLGAFSDGDTLTLFLTRTSRAAQAEALSAMLLGRWGSLDRVLSADAADLVALIGEPALDLKLLLAAAERLTAGALREREVISSWNALLAYLRVRLGGRGREQFRVLFLDKRNRLLSDEVLGEGTVDHAPVYPREIVRRALQLDACALILAHNHPSGDPTPSSADITVTREVIEACKALKIIVHDHVVVGEEATVSFKQLGLF